MKITLIGTGCGTEETLTEQARKVLAGASLVLGADRLLKSLPSVLFAPGCKKICAAAPAEIAGAIEREGAREVCVLLSGDSGFYSGARGLLPLLKGKEVQIFPGISSVQALAARLERPWQDWALYSAHGAPCDIVADVCGGRPCFFLTGGKTGPAALCSELAEAGLGELAVTVGENLTCPDERIVRGTAGELQTGEFAPLSVLLAEPAPRFEKRTPGLPDELFERLEKVPMTKQVVRAAILSALAVGSEDVCWDVGAGTGSVSIELALQARAVWGVEKNAEALRLAEENRKRFGAWNLRLTQGEAPEALSALPRPDAVFVGGSGGRLEEILEAALRANPSARICVAAAALETLQCACGAFASSGYEAEVVEISVSRSRAVGSLHLMTAHNPVFLITGRRA